MIQKITGLDLRKFDDASICSLASMDFENILERQEKDALKATSGEREERHG